METTFYTILLVNVYFNNFDKTSNLNAELHPQFIIWEKRMEFIYVFFTSILMVYLFNPWAPKLYLIDNDIIVTLYLFAVVLIIRANWPYFINETTKIKYILFRPLDT